MKDLIKKFIAIESFLMSKLVILLIQSSIMELHGRNMSYRKPL